MIDFYHSHKERSREKVMLTFDGKRHKQMLFINLSVSMAILWVSLHLLVHEEAKRKIMQTWVFTTIYLSLKTQSIRSNTKVTHRLCESMTMWVETRWLELITSLTSITFFPLQLREESFALKSIFGKESTLKCFSTSHSHQFIICNNSGP